MPKRFSKSTETRDEIQLPAILCQDACQRLMLHPYITASRTSTGMVSEVRIQVYTVEKCVANTCI